MRNLNIFLSYSIKEIQKTIRKGNDRKCWPKRVPMYSIINYPLDIKHTLTEQKAIAKVLSDVDKLITSIEKLIDKNRK